MNKKVNYVLFLLAATIVNIIIMILIFLILFVIIFRIFGYNDASGTTDPSVAQDLSMKQYLIFIPILASIFGSFFIYSKLMKLFREKVDMEKYFEPLFKSRFNQHQKKSATGISTPSDLVDKIFNPFDKEKK